MSVVEQMEKQKNALEKILWNGDFNKNHVTIKILMQFLFFHLLYNFTKRFNFVSLSTNIVAKSFVAKVTGNFVFCLTCLNNTSKYKK